MTYKTTLKLNAAEALFLSDMAEFYRMPVAVLLLNAMQAGLDHAEFVMMENQHHHQRIEAAMQACAACDEPSTTH